MDLEVGIVQRVRVVWVHAAGLSMLTFVCVATMPACSGKPVDERARVDCVVSSDETSSASAVTIVGAGSCDRGIEATVEVDDMTGGGCISVVVASVLPGDHRMWFVGTSGEGRATGRWNVRPVGAEGVGVMSYPRGRKAWPIAPSQLDPGTYTLSVPGVTCGAAQYGLEPTLRISRTG